MAQMLHLNLPEGYMRYDDCQFQDKSLYNWHFVSMALYMGERHVVTMEVSSWRLRKYSFFFAIRVLPTMNASDEMDDCSIDALREILQDMTNTIELLSSGQKSGDALIQFLEEVLRTIEAWAYKYNVVIDGHLTATEHSNPYQDPDSLTAESNPSGHNGPDSAPNGYNHAFAVLRTDHHSGLNVDPNLTAAVNASQMMEQLELALDLDHDVHVNVNELMDLAHQRINDGHGSERPTFSWEVHDHKTHVQFRGEAEGAFSHTGQDLSFHDSRIEHDSQACQMQVPGRVKEDSILVQDEHLMVSSLKDPSMKDSTIDKAMTFRCDKDLTFASPNHMPKSLKLDMVTQYDLMTSETYGGRREVMNSSDWLDKQDDDAYQ